MATSFNPKKNPYSADLLRLSRAPESRFTGQERHVSACLLVGKLYGLELASSRILYWRTDYVPLIFVGKNKIVLTAVVFESESLDERLKELDYWTHLVEPINGGAHVLVLKVGESGVRELHNGEWHHSRSSLSIRKQFQSTNALGSSADPEADSIPPRSDEEASIAYFGNDSDQRGAGGGGNGDGSRRGGGGGGGFGDGGGGDQEPSDGGVRELLNHPVLFSVEAETLRAILENA